MSKQGQGTIARQFWADTARGKIGPEQLYQRQRDVLAQHVLPLLAKTDHVLDMGCADGDFTLLFAQAAGAVQGFDLSESLIAQARDKSRTAGLENVTFSVTDVFSFDSTERFEMVSLMGVLTTISDDLAAARILLRAVAALKDDGYLVLKDSVLLDASQARVMNTGSYEAKYRPEADYLKQVKALGLQLVGRYPLLTMDNFGQTSTLYIFKQALAQPQAQPHKGVRVACYGSMPFHFRSLRPLAECFQDSLLSLSIDEVMAWKPQVIAVADGWSVEFWRDYCDAHNVLLIGMRHGSVTRYGFAEPQYACADYLCGSVWDIDDTLASHVMPRSGFLLTGNSWVDQVFRLPARAANPPQPTILFAPTYNPELSAAVHFGERVVALIRQVYPQSKIIIKPHPAIVSHEHAFVTDKDLFRGLMTTWREQAKADPLVSLVDDPEASIADSFAEADILLADRSSLLFEFMTLDRPILLFSSEARVAHWEYNPEAPGNAWRDIGLEFSSDDELLALLRDPFTQHAQQCSAAQKQRSQQLYGRHQDGQSVQRVAAAIAQAPRLLVVIDGRNAEHLAELVERYDRCFAFKHLHVIGDLPPTDGVRVFASLQAWAGAMAQHEHASAVLLVEGAFALAPGSAHQVSDLLPGVNWEQLQAAQLQLPAHFAQPSAAGSANWEEQRLAQILQRQQADSPWLLLPGSTLARELALLPAAPSEANIELWWQTLALARASCVWPVDALNLIPGEGVLRLVGKGRHMFAERALLVAVPTVVGRPPQNASVKLALSAFAGQEYSRFPFRVEIRSNGQRYAELLVADTSLHALTLPFRPDADGQMQIEVISHGSFAGLNGLSAPVSLLADVQLAPALSSYCPALGGASATQTAAADEASAPRVSEYSTWLAHRQLGDEAVQRYQPLIQQLASSVQIQVLVCAAGAEASAVQHTLDSLQRQVLAATGVHVFSEHAGADQTVHWHTEQGDWIAFVNAVAAASSADWLLVIHAGDELADSALLLLAERAQAQAGLACCYSDEDNSVLGHFSDPLLKPDFNLDLLRSYPYTGRSLAIKRQALLDLGGLSKQFAGLALQDFTFRAAEQLGLDSVGHVAEVLYHAAQSFGQWLASAEVQAHTASVVDAHLDRLGVAHAVAAGHLPVINRITYLYPEQPLVSIVIPTKDQLPLLQRCVETLLEKTAYPHYEVLIVDNASETAEAKDWLNGIEQMNSEQIRVIRQPGPFNFSAINNGAIEQARGEYLVLLNNDTAILRSDWLDELLNHARRPEVGIVGAKLLYPDGAIQHGGVVLGLNGPADHPFIRDPGDSAGYMHRLLVTQNYSAVTAACLMIRTEVYREVGGLDEVDFKVSYNDVDLCLKVRQAGYLTVWTPYSVVLHEGSVSQKSNVDTLAQEKKLQRFRSEQEAMYRKWLPLLARDPAYNRNLSLDRKGFELDHSRNLTWQPFTFAPLPRVVAHPADRSGCGHYRVRQPFRAMQNAGLIDGAISEHLLTPIELERFDTDVLILQRQVTDEQLETITRFKSFSRAFRVYELDDYLPNLPLKSLHRADMPKDILRSLRRALGLVDRFVVSTQPLAEAFADLHGDIRVVPNRLPTDWWGGLSSQRRVGRKPRVGWAGGVGHTGDLELIIDVVRDLADEVEWVFFGLCPERLRPYVHEFHSGVSIDKYPELLASLDLDLALAPLEQNQFNDCKSNLRLLEYGVLGFPVICSDVVCYRDGLPVTRVKNRYKDWMDAIRMHLSDLDATAKAGDELRQIIRRDWMLEGANLQNWAKAWLPG
ncbi:glycosyltransferase [Pseudomonas turukhanskensis]|uniref:Flagellar glycosyl transferase FgtA n=1 Tax=Pseudomonas turukhanskensis TaxID=1806536 RepID=A0A9W6K740_9PSED|nr:glycosyltransferase [Pseudomonas turukhanskensis]GLK89448.1 flagellar glycosyl transferase FgtA [Pseudomonas turukhanskensis]